VATGAGEILLTSWDRDGTRSGYDLDVIAAVASAVSVPVIASGGADRAEHLVAAIRAGASAALIASILHDRDTTVGQLKQALGQAGILVRP
jgi:imidazole glycerol phosphate synthase subunit HisF